MPSYSTPEGKYHQQMLQAKQRAIPWEFTFETWWGVWLESGKWEQRGKCRGDFVMSRQSDTGPYSVGNVRIVTVEENHTDAYRNGRIPGKQWPRKPKEASAKRPARGWTYLHGAKNPYQVMRGSKYIGRFPTQEAAEAAYAEAVAAHLDVSLKAPMVFRSPESANPTLP